MRRKIAIGLLAFGAVGGFAAGCARMHRAAHWEHGSRHDRFVQYVADACVHAAHGVFEKRSP